MDYPAHIRYDGGNAIVQTVEAHCKGCAMLAAAAAAPNMTKTAYLCGLLHDMGKYTEAFSVYIRRVTAGEYAPRGSVNHTFAGARFALERWHTGSGDVRDLASELIAFSAAAHHGQFDCIGEDGQDGFLHRLTAPGIGYPEARAAFLTHCATEAELDGLFATSVEEVERAMAVFRPNVKTSQEMLFQFAMLARHTLSAVIDGDRRDTAAFHLGAPPPARTPDWQRCLQAVEDKLQALSGAAGVTPSEINRVRQSISQRCREAAARGSGVFRLNIPTGGGKTLASLRYALAAAAQQEKRRVFFVIPLLSILEQNARVIREYLDDDSLILEHHSNVVRERPQDGELDVNELLMETWDAPVVITTLVQLLNTLFSGKTSCIRRMAALRDSVIVIDEVQSLPRTMLSQFNMAVNYLSAFCGVSVVLCSATQPCLEQVAHPMRLAQPSDLVAHEDALWSVFRRTEILDRCRPGYSMDELAAFARRCAAEQGSVLLICNTKAQALGLYRLLCPHERTFHLSTAMCMEHRIGALEKINAALRGGERIICVSTQLVEAGVDFSFGCVIRILAGMDNAVQAAGRCNRHGERPGTGPVYLVRLLGENLARLPEIYQAQKAAEQLLALFEKSPEDYGGELCSDAAITAYYRALYAEMRIGEQDYPLPQHKTSLVELLSDNREFRRHCQTGGYVLCQAFRTAGEHFHVFSENTTDVLVPYGGGARLIEALCSNEAKNSLTLRAKLLRQAGQYTVSVYEWQLNRLRELGGVYPVCEGAALALLPEYYADEVGLCLNGENMTFLEV